VLRALGILQVQTGSLSDEPEQATHHRRCELPTTSRNPNTMESPHWQLEQTDKIVYRISSSQDGSRTLALLLHGRTGDENSMGIFASSLPHDCLKVCPRGIVTDEEGGYAWHPRLPNGQWPKLRDFNMAVVSLAALVDSLRERHSAQAGQMIVIGFSQGAALACAFTLQFPAQVGALVLLSGFIPQLADSIKAEQPLRDKAVLVAHGIQDPLLPLALAERGVLSLEELGAHVELCETSLGHKVGAECLRVLQEWLLRLRS
jgi:phospholipase/carboxylesterase